MGEGESLVLLLVYVDDILLFSSSDKEIDGEEREVVTPLPSEFKLIKAAEGGGPADFLTKRLAEEPHWRCARMVGMSLN
ncbi:hypothetical protein CLOP_g7184 [Closterium sp. NIES-67]|nr:hypothetical protein CLOP_g7184 [Closterium sp. NIES-67]